MKRRLISVLISLLLIISSVYPALTVAYAATWNGTRSTPELSGGVYQIATAEELAWFANAVNTGSPSIKGLLISDIYLNDDGSYTNEWTPIGIENHPFSGTFDGNSFTIHGLYINSTDNCIGLFGNVNVEYTESEDAGSGADFVLQNTEVNIKNINVVSSSIKGNQNVGGIVGYGYHVGLENCSYSGDIVATYNSIGGIIGWAYAESVVSECHSSGSVEGEQRTGSIAGFASSNSVVNQCYSNMSVKGLTNVGGIVGTLSGSTLQGCFYLGSVEATDRVGGVYGYSAFGIVTSAYSVAPITSTGTSVGGAAGVEYGSTDKRLFYCYEVAGVDGNIGVGRTLAEMQESNFVRELNNGKVFFCYDYTKINNNYPVLTWMLQKDVWLGELKKPSINTSGTYIISKPSELAWFAALVNGTLDGYDANPSANATVISNILLNIDVHDDSMGIMEWTPIGTPTSPYTGTFNGGGYNIAGVYTTSTSGVDGNYVGLFGYVGTGSIINTVVIDGLVSGIENVGGIAGYMCGGSINNSCCTSEVQGDKAVGGIVGNLSSSTSSITASCMLGTVTGTNFTGEMSYLLNVGGIVGYNNRATITKCFTYGKINAPLARYVGGLVGNSSGGTVTISYNASPVIGNANVGGLIGNNNNGTVKDSYSLGKVTGSSLAGMAFGSTSGANVSNCYFDNSYATINNITTGATGLAPSAMTGTQALTNMSLSTSNWKGTAQDQYYYYYPQIISLGYSSVKFIKNASLTSVKRVQKKFLVRVEIDGRDNTYYESINDALNYVSSKSSTVLPTIYAVRDIQVASTINIDTTVGFFGDNGAIIERADGFTGPIFNITGTLVLGSDKYGDDANTGLYINGNNVEGTDSGIIVNSGAHLKVSRGVAVYNFTTATNSTNPILGAAIRVDSGDLEISGGLFYENICKSAGGVISNTSGTVNMSGGTFDLNEGTKGAVVYTCDGTTTISGGAYTNNIASSNGGVAATTGVYGKTIVTGTAQLNNNAATEGGALSALNYSTVEISGGTITQNTAYSTGGAMQIELSAEALITGGVISDNNSNHSLGSAIYNNGTLSMKEAAQVDSSNDIYLVTGKKITVLDRLTCSGYAATLSPQNYIEGTKVLDGDAMSTNYLKFGMSNTNWHTLANGAITSMETTTVAIVSKPGAYSVEYITLADAFASVKAGETANITIVADSMITGAIDVNGDITVTCDDDTFITSRSGSYYGVLFNVKPDAILRFGEKVITPAQQAQADFEAGTDTQGMFVLDGGYKNTGVVGGAAVNVQTGGKFYMYDDACIQNFFNTTTGTVTVSGEMHMFGGIIRDNSACYGGAAYIKSTGSLTTYGGVINNNTSTNGGDAVYSLGTVTRNVHSYDYWYVEKLYDEDGEVTGTADPVYQKAANTDILIPDNSAIYVDTNTIYDGVSQSDVYVTDLTQVPDDSEFTMNLIKVDLKDYTVGSAVISGTNVIDTYTSYQPYRDGYYFLYDGTLGLNKLVAKSTSGLTINSTKKLISGIDLDCATAGEMSILFENNRALIKFYDIYGTKLKNTSPITTGCSVQLTDTDGTVIDTLTLVVYGDVNCDYKIDGQDSVLIEAFSQGMLNVNNTSVAQLEAADVNFDGSVTQIDSEHTNMSGLFLHTVGQSK